VRTTLQNAEMVKYTSNALLATLITLSNEIAGLCEQTPGCDIDVVMDAVHLDRRLTPVVGNRRVQSGILAYLRAGSGYGGSCFPKDVYALRMFARELGMPVPLLDAVAKVNSERPRQVMSYLAPLLGPLQGQTIAVLGLAFKPETDDLRCSPALEIVALLQQAGAHVKAYDPVALAAATGLESPHFTLCSSPEQALAGADAAIIATAWPEIARWDWSALSAQMRRACVIDVRNGFRQTPWPASVQYVPIGKALEPDDAHAQTLGECQAGS
jgi:UDPglucose 6-dehydrogenase/GDP-mannose 6-dehydrogenase